MLKLRLQKDYVNKSKAVGLRIQTIVLMAFPNTYYLLRCLTKLSIFPQMFGIYEISIFDRVKSEVCGYVCTQKSFQCLRLCPPFVEEEMATHSSILAWEIP